MIIRFHLDAFTGECAGDVAVELHRECGCTLFALIYTTAGSPFLSFSSSGGREGGQRLDSSSREQGLARVHPDYGEVLGEDDVGVFIGANHMVGVGVWMGGWVGRCLCVLACLRSVCAFLGGTTWMGRTLLGGVMVSSWWRRRRQWR